MVQGSRTQDPEHEHIASGFQLRMDVDHWRDINGVGLLSVRAVLRADESYTYARRGGLRARR